MATDIYRSDRIELLRPSIVSFVATEMWIKENFELAVSYISKAIRSTAIALGFHVSGRAVGIHPFVNAPGLMCPAVFGIRNTSPIDEDNPYARSVAIEWTSESQPRNFLATASAISSTLDCIVCLEPVIPRIISPWRSDATEP